MGPSIVNKFAQAAKAAKTANPTYDSNAATVDRINQVFAAPSRQQQYQDFGSAYRQRLLDVLGKQKDVTDRQNRFSVARSGLTGGSHDVDSQRAIGERFQEGVLDAEDKAQNAVSDLRAADDSSRLDLIGMARGGTDATTAASRAIGNLRQSIGNKQQDNLVGGIGDFFSQFTDNYRRKQDMDAYRAGYYGNKPFGRS